VPGRPARAAPFINLTHATNPAFFEGGIQFPDYVAGIDYLLKSPLALSCSAAW
jgi:hypothetical protein